MKKQRPVHYFMNEKLLDHSIAYTSCCILGLPAEDSLHKDIVKFDLPEYLDYHFGGEKQISNEMIDDILASKSYLVQRWKYMAFEN